MKLSGLCVLVTRPQHQAGALTDMLRGLGAEVFALAAIEIAPLEDFAALDRALRSLGSFDTVVLTSANGVSALLNRLETLSISLDNLSSRCLAVIGPATGNALAKVVRPPDVMPTEFVSEALGDALGEVSGKRILLCRADIARPELAEMLIERGAEVTQVATYRIVQPNTVIDLPSKAPDFITLTSSSGVFGTYEVLERNGRQNWMSESKLVCIGPITADSVKRLGYAPAAVASDYTIQGLVDALVGLASTEAARA